MIVICCGALSGCGSRSLDVHQVGGAGDQSDPAITLRPPPDHALEARLAAIYGQIDGLGEVDVRVRDGVVHLEGVTESVVLEQRAARIARRLEGVVDVSSEIRSEPADRLLASTARTFRDLGRGFLDLLPKLAAAALALVPFVLLSWAVGRWRRPLHWFGVRQITGSILRFVLRGLVIVGGLVLAFEILGIAGIVGAVLGTLGLLGLAAGIAFKDWASNYVPSLMLGLHPPFRSGDLVQVGEYEGRVVKITPRATVLVTLDGDQVRLPNALMFQHALINLSHHRERRVRFTIPLALVADLSRAQELGVEALRALEGIVDDPPPFMRTSAITPGVVQVEFFAWADQRAVNFRTIESRARRAVLEALSRAGVPLAEESVVVRHARERPVAEPPPDAAIAAQSERRDADFVDRQFEQARLEGASAERDLLAEAEGRSPAGGQRAAQIGT